MWRWRPRNFLSKAPSACIRDLEVSGVWTVRTALNIAGEDERVWYHAYCQLRVSAQYERRVARMYAILLEVCAQRGGVRG